MIEATVSMPNIPMLLTVEVPPTYSLGFNLPSLARLAKSLVLLAIYSKPKVSALYTIGVINPPSIATATLISECLNLLIKVSCQLTLTSG